MNSQTQATIIKAIKELWKSPIELRSYINGMVNCWEMDGFTTKYAAQDYYNRAVMSIKIRKYCRSQGISTRKGETVNTTGYENPVLWSIITKGDINADFAGMSWRWRRVDGNIKNITIWF